ncbi:hypothetical protein [Alcaligenes faecalis]|uniref:hypothetical protein n=1 Tax=Alcaligenes faecalis TaxID=511 RepID=UPI002933138B|nr:hypothetical protein [Alcaligenes faecalis]MDV2115304.1 hypothetical protein [Alcaligenes faecalis]
MKKLAINYATILMVGLFTSHIAYANTGPTLPTFETKSCDTVPGYDPEWASYGEEYGLSLTPKKDYDFIFGFYQMAEKDDKLYVAFGGAIGADSQPVKGARPGAVVILNANNLQYEKSIALPFHAHAMTLDESNSRLIVTHTSANAFSLIDLETEQVRCLKPDTKTHKTDYKGRYVQTDENGSFYINYNTIENGEGNSILVKYNKDGEKNKDFKSEKIENNVSFPLLYSNNKILTGSKGIKEVSSKTGKITPLSSEKNEINLFNYSIGNDETILATNMNSTGDPGIYLFDIKNKNSTALFTGSSALEIAYKKDSSQIVVSNLESKTVSIIPFSENERKIDNSKFRNIVISDETDFFFRGLVSNLLVRKNTKNTEFFVTQKFWADKNREKHGLISKITLADFVTGIEGLENPGSCYIQTFNMADKSVTEKKECRVIDEQETLRREIERIEKGLENFRKEKEKTEKAINTKNNKTETETKKLEEYLKILNHEIPQAEGSIVKIKALMNEKT